MAGASACMRLALGLLAIIATSGVSAIGRGQRPHAKRADAGFMDMSPVMGFAEAPAKTGLGTPDPFCYLPFSLAEWDFQNDCNGEPQFLSAFCEDHANVKGDALVMTLDNNNCHTSSSDSCHDRKTAGAAFQSRESVKYGNITFRAKIAGGSGVTTTLVAYGSASIGFTFDGGKGNSTTFNAGNDYFGTSLPFDPYSGFHDYTFVWGPNSTEFLVDNISYHVHNSSVTSDSLYIWAFLYACGASYCTPFSYSGPTDIALASVAYTPLGETPTPNCSNPPQPPSFCDQEQSLGKFYTTQTACYPAAATIFNASLFGFCASHALADNTTSYLAIQADQNMSCYLPNDCRGQAKYAVGQWQGPSYVHLGQLTLDLAANSGDQWGTGIQLGDASNNVTLHLDADVKQAYIAVNGNQQTVSLNFDATQRTTYVIRISYTNVTVGTNQEELATFQTPTTLPRMSMTMLLYPRTAMPNNDSVPQARLYRAAYTALGDAAASCDQPQLTQIWSQDFDGSALDGNWTVYDNCTHGSEEELYVSSAVTVSDGTLKLTAFLFEHNETDQAGHSHFVGSGWVDTASNRSNYALNDCGSKNPDGFSLQYGRIDVNAKIPSGHFWPAIWMMPDADVCWPTGGEVDILETDIWRSKSPPYEIIGTYHWSSSQCYANSQSGQDYGGCPGCDFSNSFHTYSVEMTPRTLTYLIDDTPYHTVTQVMTSDTLPQHPMYLILGNQMWQGWNFVDELPASFEIDWVKAYRFQ